MDAQNAGAGAQVTAGRLTSGSSNLDPGTYALRAIASLAFVLSLIVLAVYFLRKFGRRSSLLTVLAGPSLATVLGKVHLARGTSLHYVETGGRVLVVGVTPTTVSLVAEFDASAFEAAKAEPDEVATVEESGPKPGLLQQIKTTTPKPKVSFLQHLLSTTRSMDSTPAEPAPDDADITQLRGDIERLQRHLQDLSRDTRD
jgi:flagellar biogenesis protein FliO